MTLKQLPKIMIIWQRRFNCTNLESGKSIDKNVKTATDGVPASGKQLSLIIRSGSLTLCSERIYQRLIQKMTSKALDDNQCMKSGPPVVVVHSCKCQ